MLIPVVSNAPEDFAAANHIARLVNSDGGFHTSISAALTRVPIIVTTSPDPYLARQILLRERTALMQTANAGTHRSDSGHCHSIETHVSDLTTGHPLLMVLMVADTQSSPSTTRAMAESIAVRVEQLTNGNAHVLAATARLPQQLASAQVTMSANALSGGLHDARELSALIVSLHQQLMHSPELAEAHNTRILKSVAPVMIASGRDPRATIAAAQEWAMRSGTCSVLAHWERDAHGQLLGTLQMPVSVESTATTALHSLAPATVYPHRADDLGQLLAAVVLAQSLAVLHMQAREQMSRRKVHGSGPSRSSARG